MVRTKASTSSGSSGSSRKAVGASAPRKALGGSSSGNHSACSSPSGGKNKYAGGNPVCDRPTPDWQKGISGFLVASPKGKGKENATPDESEAGGSSSGCSSSQGSDAGQSASSIDE